MLEKEIPRIVKITVKGFKSIAEECAIEIRPLTVLAGANSAGKSSFMQPFLLLKQTLEAPYDPGPLLLDGPNVKFTSASQLLSRLPGAKMKEQFHIQLEMLDRKFSSTVEMVYKKEIDDIEIVKMVTELKTLDHLPLLLNFTVCNGMSPEKFKEQIDQNLAANSHLLAEGATELESMVYTLFMPEEESVLKRSRGFLSFGYQNDYFESQTRHNEVTFTFRLPIHILNSIHIPGLRGNPERAYKLVNIARVYPGTLGTMFPGTFENYAASVVHEWQETGDDRLKQVSDALVRLGLTRKISTRRVDGTRIEVQVDRFRHSRTGETDMVSIADVGFGVSQVLPVIVAVIAAEPGQLVYMEQPELHLHPRAQVALAGVLADAARRGVRVVVETHSSLLLLGIQTLVAEGDLAHELVKLHWFSRNEDEATEVTSGELDEAGTYGPWPEDFDDVDLEAQSRYLDAIDYLRFGKKGQS